MPLAPEYPLATHPPRSSWVRTGLTTLLNVGQRIVLNHAIVYNKAVVFISILLTLEFYAHSRTFDRFVLPRAIDNHERTIMPKSREKFDLARYNRIRDIFYRNVRTYHTESIICFY